MKKILALAILATMFVGCDEENTPEKNDFIPTGVYFSYGVDATTRTSVEVNGNTTQFLWSAGDKLGISCEESNKVTNKQVSVAAEYDGKNEASIPTGIEFNGDAEHTFYLYYPYKTSSTAYPVNITSVSHTLKSSQNGVIGANDFMWDKITTTVAKPVVSSEMKHPFAYIRFYIVNIDEDDTSINGKTVSSITMSADGTLAGDFVADFNNFEKNLVNFGGATSKSVTLTAPLQVLSKAAYTEAKKSIPANYPVMIINPTGVGASFDASVQVAGMAPMNTTFDMKGKKFEANNFYNIGLGGSFVNGKLTFTVIDWERVTLDVTFN